jgi:hypothetical protein
MTCTVPDILWANSSENLQLRAVVGPGFLGIGRHVAVTAYCQRHSKYIDDPFTGCEACNGEKLGRVDWSIDE